MALFKIAKGKSANLPQTYNEGYCYFTTDNGKMYIDTSDNAAGRVILNAGKADSLAIARTINGTSFNGTGNITTANWGTARNISIADATSANTGSVTSVNGSGNVTLKLPATIVANLSGNANTATKLQTAHTINGTSFNGSADITTANWGTARTLTIGNTGKSINGSTNISWSLAEIGALPLTGGTLTGNLAMSGKKITGLGTPSANTDAATKAYVDAQSISTNINLPASGWVNDTQTITVNGVTVSNNIFVSPDPSNDTNFISYSNSSIRCVNQGTNQLTFKCDLIPDIDLDVNVLILA